MTELELITELRQRAQEVLRKMKLSPGGDLYTYRGSTTLVHELQEAVNWAEEWCMENDPELAEEDE